VIGWLVAAAAAAGPEPAVAPDFHALTADHDGFEPWEEQSTLEDLAPIDLGDGWVAIPVLRRSVVLAGQLPGEILDVETVAPGEEIAFSVADDQITRTAPGRPGGTEERRFKNINVSRAVHLTLRRALDVRVSVVELADVRLVRGDAQWSWKDRAEVDRTWDRPVSEALPGLGVRATALDELGAPTKVALPGGLAVERQGVVLSWEVAQAPTARSLVDFVVDDDSALDWYSAGLQYQAIRSKQAEAAILEQEVRIRELAIEVLTHDDPKAARRFARVVGALRDAEPEVAPDP
jgi:hypothetical protein